jgi:beta-1,4-mannosyltransferase
VTQANSHCWAPPHGAGSLRVAFFPDAEELGANAYWRLLRQALQRCGASFADTSSEAFGHRWCSAHHRQVQVVHFHYVQQLYAYQRDHARFRWVARFARNLLYARLLGYRTVFTLHNLTPTYPLHPCWVDYLGHWVAANLTDAVIVHCETARRALARRYGRRRNVFVVPHPHYIGVYPNSMTRDESRRILGLRSTDIVFASVGGIRPNKGLDQLIDAFSSMHGDNLRLVIAGRPWPPARYVEELFRKAVTDQRITLHLRELKDDEFQIYLSAADIAVYPFRSILTSGSVILAMSFGKPVVVPAVGCLPELVTTDVGLAYDSAERDSLVGALRASSTMDLERMGEAARHKVLARTWESAATKTLCAYGYADSGDRMRRTEPVTHEVYSCPPASGVLHEDSCFP